MKDRKPETAEMAEMDKAFEDFSKACDNAIGKCQDFIDMDINKTTEPTLETQRDEVAHRPVSHSWERQVDMNGDVYIREDEDYLDRDLFLGGAANVSPSMIPYYYE